MVVWIDCSWADVLAWRESYAAWHCRVTGRLVTCPQFAWERKVQ